MSAILDKAMRELSDAGAEIEDLGFEGSMMGYMMSKCLFVDDEKWAEAAGNALLEWARAKRQVQEARRLATWDPERGWVSPFKKAAP